jgi:hypothetical protein
MFWSAFHLHLPRCKDIAVPLPYSVYILYRLSLASFPLLPGSAKEPFTFNPLRMRRAMMIAYQLER